MIPSSFRLFFFVFASLGLSAVCAQEFTLTNSLPWERPNADVVIPREKLGLDEGQTVTSVTLTGGFFPHDIPFQLDDVDGDGEWDELYVQVAIQAEQELTAKVLAGVSENPPRFKKQTDAMADANANPKRTKPAWESEAMTYAAYGAAQVDAMGKVVHQLSIDFMYREPFSSQHRLTFEHGKDFMQVINTMGAHAPFVLEPDGTIVRPWSTDAYTVKGPLKNDAKHTSRMISDGPIRAIVETTITNWQSEKGEYSCTIRYSIGAGQQHTQVQVVYHTIPEGSVLGAGIRAFSQDLHLLETDSRVVAAARNVHERNTLVPWLGRAIYAADGMTLKPIRIPDGKAPEGIAKSGPNYGVLFAEGLKEVHYAFIANWSVDDGILSWEDYTEAIDRLQQELSSPVLSF